MSQFTDPDTEVAYARQQWEDGERRLDRVAHDSHKRGVFEHLVDAIGYELEKRIGGQFTTLELALLYQRSEDWTQEVVREVAPNTPWAWDLDLVQGSAFHRMARRANDYQLQVEQ